MKKKQLKLETNVMMVEIKEEEQYEISAGDSKTNLYYEGFKNIWGIIVNFFS